MALGRTAPADRASCAWRLPVNRLIKGRSRDVSPSRPSMADKVFQIGAGRLAAVLHPSGWGGVVSSGLLMKKVRMAAERAHIESAARKLARSGEHSGWRSIERVLSTRGFSQTPNVFANSWTRSELDRLCQQARLYRPLGQENGNWPISGNSQYAALGKGAAH